jgi:hypothetical protein
MLQTALGAAVSVGLFLVGYRQTIGARRERAKAANIELERTLLKRVLLEGYDPAPADIARYIDAKAREHNVRSADLNSVTDILADVYGRVLDDDFIKPDQRSISLARLTSAIERSETWDKQEDDSLATPHDPDKRHETRLRLLAVLAGLLVSTIGAAISLLPRASESASAFAAALGASLVGVTGVATFIRLRDTRADAERTLSPAERGIRFEREVADLLDKAKIQADMSAGDHGVDFVAEIGGRRVGIEVKTWSTHTPRTMARTSMRRLLATKERLALDDLVVVTPEIPAWAREIESDGLQIVSGHDLADHLSKLPDITGGAR